MAEDRAKPCELDQEKYDADDNVKIICLGDSAVGKSKYVGDWGRKTRPTGGLSYWQSPPGAQRSMASVGVVRSGLGCSLGVH